MTISRCLIGAVSSGWVSMVEDAIKPWSLMQITFESGYFVHESHGTFFAREGAEKEVTLAQVTL